MPQASSCAAGGRAPTWFPRNANMISTPVFPRAALVACLIVLAASAWMQVNLAAMGDKGWLLFAAGEWVSGKKLYVDIFEVNPPLILWIYAAPAWISQHCPGFRDYAALGLMGLAGVAFAISLCVR